MTDSERIIQRIREIADPFGVSTYPAIKTFRENQALLLKTLKAIREDETLPKMGALEKIIDEGLRGYWPSLCAEISEIGVWVGYHEVLTKKIIAQALMDVLLEEPDSPIVGGRARRAALVRSFFDSKTDFVDREKTKRFCSKCDDEKIKPPQRKKGGPHGFKPVLWMDIWRNPSSAEYKRLFISTSSPLLKDLYGSKKA